MFTPLPITPHHPRESPGCLLQASSSTRNFLNALYMQLLQCRILASIFGPPVCVMLRKCVYKGLFLSFSHLCTIYDVVRRVSNSHVICCLNLCKFRAARFSCGGLGLWVNGEGVVGCEVWKGKVQVMMASLLRGKGKGIRSWVEEGGNAFAIRGCHTSFFPFSIFREWGRGMLSLKGRGPIMWRLRISFFSCTGEEWRMEKTSYAKLLFFT